MLPVLEAQKESSGGRVPQKPGEGSTEPSALATWCSLVILANVMERRSEGS